MSGDSGGATRNPDGFELSIKNGVLGATSVILGNVFKDFLSMSNPIAYSLGVLIGFLVSYCIPPRIETPFFKWLILCVMLAVLVFIFEKVFAPA